MKRKNTLKFISTAITSLCLIASLVFIQTSYADEQRRDHSKRFEKLAKKLDLDDSQKASLKTLLQSQREERKNALAPLKKKHDAELAEILNAEQLEKFKAMKQKRMKRMKKMGKYGNDHK